MSSETNIPPKENSEKDSLIKDRNIAEEKPTPKTKVNDITPAFNFDLGRGYYYNKEKQFFYENISKNLTASINNQYNIFYGTFFNNQNKAIECILILFSALVIIRLAAFAIKPTNIFFSDAFSGMIQNTWPYFIWISFFFVLFSIIFPQPDFTWGGVLCGSFIFFFIWILFSIIFILFCFLLIQKWNMLERSSPNYKSIKNDFDKFSNIRMKVFDDLPDTSSFIERYEYLTSKIYFIVPFYSAFSSQTLRKDFNYARYLQYSLVENMTNFYNLTVFSWIMIMFAILIWNVFISHCFVLTKLIIMSCVPLIGIIYMIITYSILRGVYRKIVPEIQPSNFHEYLDLETYNQNQAIGNFITPPPYIQKHYDNKYLDEGFTFTNFIIGRNANFFEDIICFGNYGKHFINNTLQSLIGTFICYIAIIAIVEGKQFYDVYGTWIIPYLSVLLVLYLVLYCYLLAINFRWYTILNSTEMDKKKEIIERCISDHLMESAEMAEKLYKNFKKLYFDMMINITNKNIELGLGKDLPNFNSLNRPVLTKLIDTQVYRFKKRIVENKEKYRDDHEIYSISINEELRTFLESCGNYLSDEEIEFMLHLIENFDENQNDSISVRQLYDIWGANIHFSSKQPYEIISFILEKYHEERQDNRQNYNHLLNESRVKELFKWYKEYFDEDAKEWILKECENLGKEFSTDAFIITITNSRRYHPI